MHSRLLRSIGLKDPGKRVVFFSQSLAIKEVTEEKSKAISLLYQYRTRGHLNCTINPLSQEASPQSNLLISENSLNPEFHFEVDSNEKGRIGTQHFLNDNELNNHLKNIYTGKIGYEVSHIEDLEERKWLYQIIENMHFVQATPAMKKHFAQLMIESEVYDHFMAKRFGQVKRYGLEGAEGMMVAVDIILQLSQSDHIVFGMPHRGRLNLLTGLLGYPAEAIFHKLSGSSEIPDNSNFYSADVLSHLSHTGSVKVGITGKTKQVTLLPNPSHLEAINPVQQGVVYALRTMKQQNAIAVQIHGDAAFSGQGVAQETLQMSKLKGYQINGTIHLIVNNQLGYTATATMARSARYASAPAHVIGAPIIHVNGDYPEEVARAASIAVQYQQKYGKDVVMDMICYRRHGHNELDEPSFTQPTMYETIRNKSTCPTEYSNTLIKEGIIDEKSISDQRENRFKMLDEALARSATFKPTLTILQENQQCKKIDSSENKISREDLINAAKASVTLKEDFMVHSRLQKYHIESRLNHVIQNNLVDWATAEAMAIGTLLKDGYNVRISGQDVERGTFSQRHFVFHDQSTGLPYTPLKEYGKGQLDIHNSHLSEFAVVGFEYGVSITDPKNTLPIWEAQFGDFFNGAQVIFDTFISSGESKWALNTGLTILLPHGYDGTGPEHSSCRLERFLQMCNSPINVNASFIPNWIIVNPTTPSNYFHLLRRQMLQGDCKKPLIVVSPKTLLRLPAAVSPISDLIDSGFKPLIEDPRNHNAKSIRKVVFCSGKFYYDLERERSNRKIENMVIIRIEELCPLPITDLRSVIKRYSNAKEFIWCQEEHENMGAYSHVSPRISALLPSLVKQLKYVGRGPAAAPAAGYSQLHKKELSLIYGDLFGRIIE